MKPDLLNRLFPEQDPFLWQMELWERAVIELLARRIQPEVAIDLGTANGGSLSCVAPFAKTIYTLDKKHPEEVRQRIESTFANCKLVTGDSNETLPALLKEIEAKHQALEFVLIDGGHSRSMVCKDMTNLIQHRPKTRLIMVGHDSNNPNCRAGMLDVDWASSPWVESVLIDAVPGINWESDPIPFQQWGGFVIAEITHEGRGKKQLEVRQRQPLSHQLVTSHFAHHGNVWNTLRLAWETATKRRSLRGRG